MEIIDSHMHIGFDCNNDYYAEKGIEEYLKEIKNTNIKFFIPSVNPKISLFTCKKDCSNECEVLVDSKEKVCPVGCLDRERHRVSIVDGLSGNLIAFCERCQEKIYEGPDPFRKYNLMLMELCKNSNCALPNLVLTISNSTVNQEIKFYEENFKKLYAGYKIHQTTNMRSINSLEYINSNRTILVHADLHTYDSINNVIEFSKRYEGNIVIAHSYILLAPNLIENQNNLYFDICPIDNFRKYKQFIAHNDAYDQNDNIYESALKYLNEDKLLFATDWPYGNVIENVNEIEKSSLDEKQKSKVLSLNLAKAYHLY